MKWFKTNMIAIVSLAVVLAGSCVGLSVTAGALDTRVTHLEAADEQCEERWIRLDRIVRRLEIVVHTIDRSKSP